MDDDFDDFFDDIVLDDSTLAAIQSEETKHVQSQPQRPPGQQHQPLYPETVFDLTHTKTAPTKKQKTDHGKTGRGWIPGIGSQPDLPEIAVDGGLGYGVNVTLSQKRSRAASVAASATSNAQPSRLITTPPTAAQNKQRPRTNHTSNNVQEPRRPPPPVSVPKPRVLAAPLPIRHVATEDDPMDGQAQVNNVHEIAELRRQMEELRKENERIQATMQETIDAKLSKEGEVAILRKGMQRTAQEHSTQLARLRTAKEEAESKQLRAQKDMKMEIERLKTEFMFKEHDLATNTRKPPMSVSKKAARLIPNTPRRAPPEQRDGGSPSRDRRQAPAPPQWPVLSQFPVPVRPKKQVPQPESPKKTAKLPGFQNSFLTTSPSRRRGKQKGKEKEGMRTEEGMDASSQPNPFLDEPENNLPFDPQPPPLPSLLAFEGPPASGLPAPDQAGDVGMDAVQPDTPRRLNNRQTEMYEVDYFFDAENAAAVELANRKHELLHMLLSHILPPSSAPTIQMLTSSRTSGCFEEQLLPAYSKACSRLFETMSAVSGHTDWRNSLHDVANSLVGLASTLINIPDVLPLASLLNLINTLLITILDFSGVILETCARNIDQKKPDLASLLSSIVQTRLAIDKTSDAQLEILGKETAQVFQSLSLNVPLELENVLPTMLMRDDLLWTLIDPRQPTWLLTPATEALLRLSTHHKVGQMLLSPSNPPPIPDNEILDPLETNTPYIDQLCFLLVDPMKEDARDMHTSIVALINHLLVMHPEELSIFKESSCVIASLVTLMHQVTTLLWEDDEKLLESEDLTRSAVRLTNQTLYTLYNIVVTVPQVDLQNMLFTTSIRKYNGIMHQFFVTFGRLSHDEIPAWIYPEGKKELLVLRVAAQHLLSAVVLEGPEGEAIFRAFQMDIDDDEIEEREELNEEEKEARAMIIEEDPDVIVID